jgi:drug/metabolite transporter (DMT)-like permease
VLRERERWSTLAASGLALLGVVVMLNGALAQGRLPGDALALAMTVLMAIMMVTIRRHRETPMLPAAALSAFVSALLVLPAARPLGVDAVQFGYLALFGVTQFGLGLLLLTLGSRLISPTRVALIGNLELPLAPALVWLAFGEAPAPATWAGGTLVLLAVIGDLLTARLREAGA